MSIAPVNVQRLPSPHTVTRVRASLVMDQMDGSQFRDWANATRLDMHGLLIAKQTSEDLEGAERTDTFWSFMTQPNADVLATDRMVLPGGLDAEVVGVPFVWTNHRGIPHHMSLTLRWIEG